MQKFIQRIRTQTLTSLGLLTKSQSIFVDKMSQIIINESTDSNTTSSDNELNEIKLRDDMNTHANKMIWSKAPSDKRFMNIYRVREANIEHSLFGISGIERHKS